MNQLFTYSLISRVVSKRIHWLLLSVLLTAFSQNVFAQGYIYVHKATLNEESSTNFPFTVTGGTTTVPTFSLNDQPADLPDIVDVGGGQNRLWVIAGGGKGATTGKSYYRALGSSQWVDAHGGNNPTPITAIDGGIGDTHIHCNTSGGVWYYNGSGFVPIADNSVSAVDVAYDRTYNRFLYLDNKNGSNGGFIYWKSATNTTTTGWTQIPNLTARRIDAITTPGVQSPIVFTSSTGLEVYRGDYNGTSTNLGAPTSSGIINDDVTAADDGTIYAVVNVAAGTRNVYRYSGSGSGTSAWISEPTSRGIRRISGGLAGQVWGQQLNRYTAVWSRTVGGVWLDDERVRTSITGNSEMISVAAGTYTITESAVAGWSLQNITLYDPTNNSSLSISGNTATLNVAAGEVVHVIFQNGLTQSTAVAATCGINFTENFGMGAVGTRGGALTGLTDYHYQGSTGDAIGTGSVVDGYYDVVSRTQDVGYGTYFDHTSADGTGRLFFINANYQQNTFYRRRFTNLIPGLNYTATYWILNVSGGISPNIQADVVNPTNGAVLTSSASGDITTQGVWQQKTFTFVAAQTDIDLLLRNNTIGGNGNDLAIDDISFGLTAAAPPVVATTNSTCTSPAGSLTVTSPLGNVYEYSVDGTTYQTSPVFATVAPGSFSVTARYTGTTGCVSTPTAITIAAVICGTVYNDPNGLTNSLVDGTPNNVINGNTFYVSTTDPTTGNVISTTAVQPGGTYSLTVSPNTSYSVVLSTASQTVGSPVSNTAPTGAVYTGEGTAPTGDGAPNGATPVSVVTSNVTGVNFGVDILPTPTSATLPSQSNPGGTTGIVIPPASFTGTDPDGTLVSLIFPTFPTGITSVTIAGTPYTSFPAGGVTATTGSTVSVDPTDPATSVVIPFQVVDNAGKPSSTTATVTLPLTAPAPVTLSGNILDDGNGLSDNTVNTSGLFPLNPVNGTNLDGSPLYVTLVNSTGTAIATVPVTNTGSYSFASVTPASYSLVLSTNPAGSTTPSLPASWFNVGETVGTGTGNDGLANGILPVTVGATNVADANFGIDKQPFGTAFKIHTQTNPGGGSQVTVPYQVFNTSDLEQPNLNELQGRTVTLNPATGGTLYYNGTPITSTTAISSFNPRLFTLDPTATGATSVTFTYIAIDDAGVASAPIPVTIDFIVPPANQPAFTCGDGITYLIVGTNTTNSSSSKLYTVNLLNGTFTQVSGQLMPGTEFTALNNMGYNVKDNYLWTYRRQTGELVRIGSDYSIQTFSIPNLPMDIYVSGDVDANGIMYLYRGSVNNSTVIARVDLDPASPTYLTRLPDLNLSGSGNIIDLAFNPIDGNLYGINATNNTVTRINPTTGAVTSVGPSGTTSDFGAVYFDNLGTLYVSRNPTGELYKIANVAGGNTMAILLAYGPATVDQDGARCASAPIPSVVIAGSILNDANGLTDNTVNGAPISSLGGNTFYANLVDATGNVVVSTTLTSGTYSFTATPNASYSVVLSNSPGTIGSTPPSTTLTGGVTNTGENIGTGAGSDGTPNGVLVVTVTTSNVSNANFGVQPFTPTYSLSGNVLNDVNALTDNTVNGTGVDGTVVPVYVSLVQSGSVVATVPVTSTGAYSFTNVSNGTYSVVLTTNPAGSTTPSLPASYTYTGENIGTAAGSDGTPNGILAVTVNGASVSNVNLGIEQPPTAGSGMNTVSNDGGTSPVPVPTNTFTNTAFSTDTAPGSVTAIHITAFPSNTTSLTVNGTVYTASTFPAGGVVVPTDGYGNPTVPILVDPTNDANPVSIPFKAVDNGGFESANTGTAVIKFIITYSISGNVLSDGNGLTDGTVNHIGSGPSPVNGTDVDLVTAGSQPVYATLVNSGGTDVQTVPVTNTGTYTFTGVTPGTYSVVLSTNPAGSLTPSLPTSLTNVGENLGTTPGSDGTANGILTGITVASTPVTDANFGIDQKPVGAPITVASQPNPGGSVAAPVPATAFTGTDLEDGTYPNNLTGRTVILTPATNGTLYYNSTPVTSATTITGFNPALITLDPTATGATTGNDPTFTYSVLDNAGVPSNPATVTVPFTAAVPDLTPIIYARPSTLHGNTPITVVVDVLELKRVATSGLITVRVSKDTHTPLSFSTGANLIGGRSVQNNLWSFDGSSDPVYYVLTTNQSVAASGMLSFGLEGTLSPSGTNGNLTLSAVIDPNSGGEVRINNNTDAEKIDYFQL